MKHENKKHNSNKLLIYFIKGSTKNYQEWLSIKHFLKIVSVYLIIQNSFFSFWNSKNFSWWISERIKKN